MKILKKKKNACKWGNLRLWSGKTKWRPSPNRFCLVFLLYEGGAEQAECLANQSQDKQLAHTAHRSAGFLFSQKCCQKT